MNKPLQPKLYITIPVHPRSMIEEDDTTILPIRTYVMFQINHVDEKSKLYQKLTKYLVNSSRHIGNCFDNSFIIPVGIRINGIQNINHFEDIMEFINEHYNFGHTFGELIYRKSSLSLLKTYFDIYDMLKESETQVIKVEPLNGDY